MVIHKPTTRMGLQESLHRQSGLVLVVVTDRSKEPCPLNLDSLDGCTIVELRSCCPDLKQAQVDFHMTVSSAYLFQNGTKVRFYVSNADISP